MNEVINQYPSLEGQLYFNFNNNNPEDIGDECENDDECEEYGGECFWPNDAN